MKVFNCLIWYGCKTIIGKWFQLTTAFVSTVMNLYVYELLKCTEMNIIIIYIYGHGQCLIVILDSVLAITDQEILNGC